MELLERLNQVNDVPVTSVYDPAFAPFGRVVTGYDFSGLIGYMENCTEIPENGNIYKPSIPEMEALPVMEQVKNGLYGGMDIEIGYCNGRNTTYNGSSTTRAARSMWQSPISCWCWDTSGR